MTQKEINEVARSIRRDLDGGLILQRNSGVIHDSFLDLFDRYNGWFNALEIAGKKEIISKYERADLQQTLNDTFDEQIFWMANAATDKEGK